MITTGIAVLLAVLVCLVATSWKNDMLDSVSEIAYIIPHWAFSSWIALTGILLMPDMMEHLPDGWQWIGFFCIVGLMCVAASSYYRTEEKWLHYIGGWMCGICAMIVVAFNCWPLLLLWLVYIGCMWVCGWYCFTFWAEFTVFGILCLCLSYC